MHTHEVTRGLLGHSLTTRVLWPARRIKTHTHTHTHTTHTQVLLDHYTGTVEMEALCMIDMIKQHVIPSVKSCGMGPLAELEAAAATLEADVASIHAAGTAEEKGALSRVLRLETMIEIRDICDAAEAVVPAEEWTLATYNDLLFMDMYPNSHDLQ